MRGAGEGRVPPPALPCSWYRGKVVVVVAEVVVVMTWLVGVTLWGGGRLREGGGVGPRSSAVGRERRERRRAAGSPQAMPPRRGAGHSRQRRGGRNEGKEGVAGQGEGGRARGEGGREVHAVRRGALRDGCGGDVEWVTRRRTGEGRPAADPPGITLSPSSQCATLARAHACTCGGSILKFLTQSPTLLFTRDSNSLRSAEYNS